VERQKSARLYRADYGTFEDYCREKWGFTKTYANNLIASAETVKSLPDELTTIVVKEGQARELARVEPSKTRGRYLPESASDGPGLFPFRKCLGSSRGLGLVSLIRASTSERSKRGCPDGSNRTVSLCLTIQD
jgi:hypothetical protein